MKKLSIVNPSNRLSQKRRVHNLRRKKKAVTDMKREHSRGRR